MIRRRSLSIAAAWLCVSVAAAGENKPTLAPDLSAPVRIEADGQPIDHGAVWGHAGPCVFDVDGDGKRDLVVGDFGGLFHLYRNVGEEDAPRYESGGQLMAGAEPAKVRIYCCIGSSPQFADLDGDGQFDLFSGSYDPGACYWFPGNGDGTFRGRGDSGAVSAFAKGLTALVAKATEGESTEVRDDGANGLLLRDRTGTVLLRKPDQKEEWESYGSWPFPIDWDADGDLDLLIGGFDGTVWLRENLGTASEFAFSEMPVAVEADGEPISFKPVETIGAGHAAVVAADWDKDGLFDLVSGCDDGSVRWFRNTGMKGEPVFAAAEFLVPPSGGSGYDSFVEPGAAPRPGIRSQVAVADMNGDGKPDLLVGDFSQTRSPRADLSVEERAKYEAALARHVESLKVYQERNKAAWDEGQKYWKTFPEEEQSSDAVQEKWRAKMDELRAEPDYVAAQEAYEAGNKELQQYLEKPASASSADDYTTSHGFVWLYVRK